MNDDDPTGPTIYKKKPEKSEAAKRAVHQHDPTRAVLEEDFPSVQRVQTSVSTAIMQARQALGIDRKELATRVQEREQIIREYENGTAIPSQQVLSKLERVLSVKLRGTGIGQKLSAATKAKKT